MTDQFRQEPPKADLTEGASNLVGIWQEVARHASDLAHARRTIYQAYIAEGFTETQALDLVKQI